MNLVLTLLVAIVTSPLVSLSKLSKISFYTTGAPRLVTVTAVNSTSVVLSWSEVQCFSGSGAVTHYLVQYHSSCCGGGTVQNVTTDGLVQVISGLTPNTVYTFRVAAVGAGQNIGPFSNPANTSLPGQEFIYMYIGLKLHLPYLCNTVLLTKGCLHPQTFHTSRVKHLLSPHLLGQQLQ